MFEALAPNVADNADLREGIEQAAGNVRFKMCGIAGPDIKTWGSGVLISLT